MWCTDIHLVQDSQAMFDDALRSLHIESFLVV